MSNGSSAAKRMRFSIESLIGDDSIPPGAPTADNNNNNVNNAPPGRYIRRLDQDTLYNDKFAFVKWRSSFLIEEVPANPDRLLFRLFDRCLTDAIREAGEHGVRPDKLGVEIKSPLLQKDIFLPFHVVTANTVHAMLNRFIKVAQSKAHLGSLWGEPFTVVVTTASVKDQPGQMEIRGRGGWSMGGIKRHPRQKVNHRINERILLPVRNQDTQCLFYALVLTLQHNLRVMESRAFSYYLNRQLPRQKEEAEDLMRRCGIPLGLPDYNAAIYVPMVVNYWNARYQQEGHRFKCFIFGLQGHYKPEFRYGPDEFTVPIALLHSPDHFDGIRGRSVGSCLFGRDYYCFSCEIPVAHPNTHTSTCRSLCKMCGRLHVGIIGGCPPTEGMLPLRCVPCGKVFRNGDCYQQHVYSNFCSKSKQCGECGVIWKVANNTRQGRQGHVCNERYCSRCGQFHDPSRGCFIQPLEPRQQKAYRLIAYDFETYQHQRAPDSWRPEQRHHTVNFASAFVCCTRCIEQGVWRQALQQRPIPCEICGACRLVTFSERPFTGTPVDGQFVCENPLQNFAKWILFGFDAKFPTVAVAHNAGRFDLVLLMRELYSQSPQPLQMVRKANKIYGMSMPRTNRTAEIHFKDSLNWMQSPLASLVGAFGLRDCADKEFFPYLANHPRNLDFVMPTLPPKEDYLYGGMPPEKQSKFDEWYGNNRHKGFYLPEALAEYAVNDVKILMEALVAYRAEFWEISAKRHASNPVDLLLLGEDPSAVPKSGGIDILWESFTLSGAAMCHYRLNYLQQQQIAICPVSGYDTVQTQSTLALKYINWLSESMNTEFQSTHSAEGEKRVGRFTVDAWSETLQLAVEVNGCQFHACTKRHHGWDDQTVMQNGKTAGWIRARDAERLCYLRQQLPRVDVVWECEIKEMLRCYPEMRRSYNRYLDVGPIKLRSCFFGGRTQAFRLHYKAPAGKRLHYLDVKSLYPAIIAKTAFPIAHPVVHVVPTQERIVDWRRGEQVPITGILKVFVVPPDNLDVSVLPVKFANDERMLMPLCRACALRYPEGARIRNYRCPHDSDWDRGWVSEAVSTELALALDNGYRVIRYYRALIWEQFSDELFKEYVADFFAMKTHASGFPDGVDTLEKEDNFIRECQERFGVRLQREKMVPNKAKRTIGKLFSNCLWGRFGLNPGLSKTQVTDSPAELRQYMDNNKLEVTDLDELTRAMVMITYSELDGWVQEGHSFNPIISLWTTAHARIHLHRILQTVARAEGCVLLYCDTDSCIFAADEGRPLPLQTGPHLGDLAEEFPDFIIREFCCSGPKSYALRMQHKESGQWRYVLHIKGLSLTADVCKKIHWRTFKRSIFRFARSLLDGDELLRILDDEDFENWNIEGGDGEDEGEDEEMGGGGEIIIEYPNSIRPSVKNCAVKSIPTQKCHRPLIVKGIVTKDLIIKNFGSK